LRCSHINLQPVFAAICPARLSSWPRTASPPRMRADREPRRSAYWQRRAREVELELCARADFSMSLIRQSRCSTVRTLGLFG
jgi:hypothetical protein